MEMQGGEQDPNQPGGDPGQGAEQQAQPGGQPQEGGGGAAVPTAVESMGSQLQPGAGGMDLMQVAQKAASYMKQVRDSSGDQAMYKELERLQLADLNLYKMVVPMLQDDGSKVKPMDAASNPTPSGTPQKDPSRAVG